MDMKTSYIILAMVFVGCSIGFFFFRDRILLFLYGYDYNLINSITFENYTAYKNILFGKKIFLIVNALLSFSCMAASFYIRNNRVDINTYFVSVMLYASLIISIVFIIIFILSFILPTRIV